MNTVLGVVAVVAVLAGILTLFRWQPLGRNRARTDFEHFSRALLRIMKNGGIYRVEHIGSDVTFDLVRTEDATGKVIAVLKIPRAEWSVNRHTELKDAFRANAFCYKSFEDADSNLVGEVFVPVDDIWLEWSGAKCARAAHILLDVLSVPSTARFNFSAIGGGIVRRRPD